MGAYHPHRAPINSVLLPLGIVHPAPSPSPLPLPSPSRRSGGCILDMVFCPAHAEQCVMECAECDVCACAMGGCLESQEFGSISCCEECGYVRTVPQGANTASYLAATSANIGASHHCGSRYSACDRCSRTRTSHKELWMCLDCYDIKCKLGYATSCMPRIQV